MESPMVNISELIDGLKGDLAECDFSICSSIIVGEGHHATAIATNGKTSPKLVCAVASVPPDVTGVDEAAGFVRTLRRGLTSHFRGLPRPKRLGTCTVLLCGRELSKKLAAHKERLIDSRGLHVNVMLGTVLVDTETYTSRSDVTWGLMDIATAFSRIQSVVENWCARYRRPRKLVPAGRRALKIA